MHFLWILIPLAGIALAGFTEWLKFKRSAASLGESTLEVSASVENLKEEIKELRQERKRLVQRIQNLEAIVTSEAWEVFGSDPELAQSKLPELPLETEDDEAKVARVARRLRG